MLKDFFKRLPKIFLNRDKKAEQHFYTNALEIDTTTPVDQANKLIKIVPVGLFPTHPDGPHEITPQHIQEMAANLKNGGTDVLFDFGHESIWDPSAEAAAWSPKDKVQAMADGLYIEYPQFTTKGQEKVNGKAYKYFSPAYLLNKTDKNGKEIGAVLHSIGLVNKPYMDTEIDNIGNSETNNKKKDIKMNAALLKFLGLPDTATEADMMNAVKTLAAKYGLPETATMMEVITKAEEAAAANPSTQKNSEVLAELASLKAAETARHDAEVETFVNQAITDGKIIPALKDQTIADAKKNFAAIKEDIDKRAKNSALPPKLEPGNDTHVDVKDPKAIAKAAREYINSQAKIGNVISSTEAVNHVVGKQGA